MSQTESPHTDILIAGAGAGGICAAIQAARQGARVLLVEKEDRIGGTGVHSPVALVCKFQRRDTYEPINIGLHKELFREAYTWRGEFTPEDQLPTYDHQTLYRRYQELTAAEPSLEILTGCGVTRVETRDGRIHSVTLENGQEVRASVYVDGTANGNLSDMAGAQFDVGRPGDQAMQSATLTFTVRGYDVTQLKNPAINTWGGYWSLNAELTELYDDARERGEVTNPKHGVICFAYPDGKTLLFNSNEVPGVDPMKPGAEESARKQAETYVHELMTIIRRHPAFADAHIETISPRMGIREGRRIHGDYTLTGKECMAEARFEDMVAACAYDLDIHDPDGGKPSLIRIPNTQYYHIPYRSLIARGFDNLLLGSRCISGDFEAHSSYRVMSGVTGIGQACGAAAALAVRLSNGRVRDIPADWIRFELRKQGQFIEGNAEPPPASP
jgi:glycine/D-amino acid oxidase-like deaminating enzyme